MAKGGHKGHKLVIKGGSHKHEGKKKHGGRKKKGGKRRHKR